jgi:signal transduction histidine kinase
MKIKIFDLFIDKNHIEHIVEHLKNNENITNVEIAVRHSDNSVFWVLASFQAMVFQGRKSFIAGFYDITKRKQLEKEILEISDREQSRIGQDLHDDLCQRLAGIAAMITALENNLKMDKYDDSKKAEQISLFLNEAIVQTKKLARGFYPVTLENHGLIYSIEELANNINMQHDISCKFYYNKDIKIKDKSVALHLYRITQEAVYNAVKHSEAAHIFIKLINDENLLSLIIEDDGKGFNCNSENLSGMGLKIMNYRSNMIGGKITVKSSDHGTSITCMIKV